MQRNLGTLSAQGGGDGPDRRQLPSKDQRADWREDATGPRLIAGRRLPTASASLHGSPNGGPSASTRWWCWTRCRPRGSRSTPSRCAPSRRRGQRSCTCSWRAWSRAVHFSTARHRLADVIRVELLEARAGDADAVDALEERVDRSMYALRRRRQGALWRARRRCAGGAWRASPERSISKLDRNPAQSGRPRASVILLAGLRRPRRLRPCLPRECSSQQYVSRRCSLYRGRRCHRQPDEGAPCFTVSSMV